jgi:hypothetical protein
MNETIIMRLAWYKTLINSVTYVADTPIGSYEIDVITDNGRQLGDSSRRVGLQRGGYCAKLRLSAALLSELLT